MDHIYYTTYMSNEDTQKHRHAFIKALHDAVYNDEITKIKNAKAKGLDTRRRNLAKKRKEKKDEDQTL